MAILTRRKPGLSLDAVRAVLGCCLVVLQALTAFTQGQRHALAVLAGDWGFATSVAAHTLWITTIIFAPWRIRYCCCMARIAPKLALVMQLVSQGVLPATAPWFNGECFRRQRWAWRAIAETFFYSCEETPHAFVVPAAFYDIVCSSTVWASTYLVTHTLPAPTAIAYALSRALLAVIAYYWQRKGVTQWLCTSVLARWSWASTQVAAASKAEDGYTALGSETPVRFSVMCCNNPSMLSRIAAASSKDLEPVRLERLGVSEGGPGGELRLSPPGRPGVAAATAGGTEAYELARRLVSSAGAGGSVAAGASADDGGPASHGRGYTSTARKVRVCVKIPDRSPEELPAGWDGGLQIDGQRDSAVVLFTYMRRGCIQLVFDLFGYRHAGAPAGPAQAQAHELPPGPPGGGCDDAAAADVSPQLDCSVGGNVAAASGGVAKANAQQPEAAGAAAAASLGLPNPVLTRQHLLRVVQDEGLLDGRTVTVQVGPSVSLVHMGSASAGGAGNRDARVAGKGHSSAPTDAGAPPPMPPDLRVWPQVVCTSAGWRHTGPGQHRQAQPREVLVDCCWEADAPDASCWAGSTDALEAAGPLPELQLTARQQGRFLPVAAVPAAKPAGWREALARGGTTAAVGDLPRAGASQPAKASRTSCGGGVAGPVAACRLAFAPARGNGLVQVELVRGGVHSASSACVLLVSSPAVVYELEQLLVATAGDNDGVGDGAASATSGGAPSNDYGPAAFAGPMTQQLLRDFGTFLDIASSVAADAAPSSTAAAASRTPSDAPPIIAWSLPSPAPDGATPSATHVVMRAHSRPIGSGGAVAATGRGDGDAGGDAERVAQRRRQHVCAVASLGARLGFNLLRYFLTSGLPSCAGYVLDTMQEQLGLPASLVAQYVCPEGMTLLHHAARSGAFGAVAAVAGWLEARGVPPDWTAASGDGLWPLHLLAVAPRGGAVASLVQVRWREAQRAWRAAAPPPRGCGVPPAEFAVMAAGPDAARRWQRAVRVATALGAGAAWRSSAALLRRAVPRVTLRAGWELTAPALRFSRAALESEFVAWQARRAAMLDHIFLAMYIAYCASQAAKEGWAFFRGHAAGLILLCIRVVLLLFFSPFWDDAVAAAGWRWLRRLPFGRSSAPAERQRSDSGGSGAPPTPAYRGSDEPSSCGSGSGGGVSWRRRMTYEGRVMLLEALRALVMLSLVAGVLQVPDSWRRLLKLRLECFFNIVIRPNAYQLRLLPTALASALSLVGETAVMAVVVWQPTTPVEALVALSLALARGLATHGLGLGFTVLLQASARRRFLAQHRPMLANT